MPGPRQTARDPHRRSTTDYHVYPAVLERFSRRLAALGKQVMLFAGDDRQSPETTLLTALQDRLESPTGVGEQRPGVRRLPVELVERETSRRR